MGRPPFRFFDHRQVNLAECLSEDSASALLQSDQGLRGSLSAIWQRRSISQVNKALAHLLTKQLSLNNSTAVPLPLGLGIQLAQLQSVLGFKMLKWPPTKEFHFCWPLIAPVLARVQRVLQQQYGGHSTEPRVFFPAALAPMHGLRALPSLLEGFQSRKHSFQATAENEQERQECLTLSCESVNGIHGYCGEMSASTDFDHEFEQVLFRAPDKNRCYTPVLWSNDVPIPYSTTRNANAVSLQLNHTLLLCCAQLRDLHEHRSSFAGQRSSHHNKADVIRVTRLKKERLQGLSSSANSEMKAASLAWLSGLNKSSLSSTTQPECHFYSLAAVALNDDDYAHGAFASTMLDAHSLQSFDTTSAHWDWQSYENLAAQNRTLAHARLALHVGNTNIGDSTSHLDLVENFLLPFWANFQLVLGTVQRGGMVVLPSQTGHKRQAADAHDALDVLRAVFHTSSACSQQSQALKGCEMLQLSGEGWWLTRPAFVSELRVLPAGQNKLLQWKAARAAIQATLSANLRAGQLCRSEPRFAKGAPRTHGHRAGKFGEVVKQTYDQWHGSFEISCSPLPREESPPIVTIVVLVSDRTHRLGNLASVVDVVNSATARLPDLEFSTSVHVVQAPTRKRKTNWTAMISMLQRASLVVADAHELPSVAYLFAPAGARILQMSTQGSSRIHYQQHERMLIHGMAAGMRIRTYAGTALSGPQPDGNDTVEIQLADLETLQSELDKALMEIARERDCSQLNSTAICSNRGRV